jgi:hypothetical protein
MALSKRHGINQKTDARWRKRSSVADLPTGPKEPRSTVSVEEEAVVVLAGIGVVLAVPHVGGKGKIKRLEKNLALGEIPERSPARAGNSQPLSGGARCKDDAGGNGLTSHGVLLFGFFLGVSAICFKQTRARHLGPTGAPLVAVPRAHFEWPHDFILQ